MTAPGVQPTAASAQPTVAIASATGTPGKPGAAVAAADSTTGITAGISGDAAAAAKAGGTTVATAAVPAAAAAEDAAAAAEEPAAPAGPKVLRPGVYVIADPPPPPKVRPMAPNATAAGNGTAAGRNATVGPPMPTPGKNLMVVMTVMGQQARDIYKNQKALKQQVADAAGVGTDQVFFFNQTTNQDPRTGVTAMSLILNIDCQSQAECGKAGAKLFNSSSQTRLTDALARNSISMLPGTFQVYGVQQMGRYKGNETLYENKALTAPKPTTAAPVGGSEFDYNATLARVFKGMEEEEQAGKKNGKKGGKKGANDTMAGALPGDIPLAGPGVFGNFSIPMDNTDSNSSLSLPSSFGPLAGSSGNGSLSGLGGMLPADLPGLSNATGMPAEQEPAAPPAKARSSAGGFSMGAMPLLAAAAAAALLVL